MASTEPSNFSWVAEDVLAGSGYPSNQSHFQFYKQQGINHVVNLTQHKTPPEVIPSGMNLVWMPIRDFTPPSVQQINDFIQLVENSMTKKERVVCHCQWGRGRTGTMLASYLVKQGLKPDDAISKIRELRPFSIETTEQEDTVFNYHKHLQQSSSSVAESNQ